MSFFQTKIETKVNCRADQRHFDAGQMLTIGSDISANGARGLLYSGFAFPVVESQKEEAVQKRATQKRATQKRAKRK